VNILEKICDYKLSFIAEREKEVPLQLMRQMAETSLLPRGFHDSIKAKINANEFAIIAEVKKASPSKGLIRADFNPTDIAKAYSAGGAAAISVLTDEEYFQGSDDYLTAIRGHVLTPVLRKDFMLKEYQVYEARAIGADAILLIMACLEDSQAAELEAVAHSLGLDVLVEVHDEAELERALKLKSKLVGVNNRNLKTFEISLDVSKRLSKMFPEGYTQVCESGIFTHEHLQEMAEFNYKTFLVGESLMRQQDIERAIKTLLGK
jgi:indole-3-glycerol phosphate synthase